MDKFKVLFIYPNTMMATLIPINLTQLSGALRTNGIQVRLFDTTYYKTEEKSFEERRVELLQIRPFDLSKAGIGYKVSDIYKDLRKLVAEYSPDLIGITFVEDTLELGFRLLEEIKDFAIPVIAGGVYTTLSPEEVIKNENIDIICIGEGEGALLDLCEKLSKKEDISNIRNLWIKNGKEIHKNGLRDLVDLDKNYYLDFSLWGKERLIRPMYGRNYLMLHLEVERRCPFQCAYCSAPSLKDIYRGQRYYRRKSYTRVMDELRYYSQQYKFDYIYFNAESFLSFTVKDFENFAEAYLKEIGLPFWCQTRVENITEDKIKILKNMGCNSMQFGIESGNENLRGQLLRRNHTNELIIEKLKIIEKYSIPYTVNNIIGFPGETRDMIFDTIRLNRKIIPRTNNCFMFTPYRGTALYFYCVEKGHLEPRTKTQQSLDGCLMKNMLLSKTELKGIQRVFPLYCRFPEERFEEIRTAEEFTEIGNAAFQKLSKEYADKYFY